MKVFEILNFNREPLNRLREAGIRLCDVEYIDLYNEFRALVADGNKVTYAVAVLAVKYSVSERSVYNVVSRFERDCKLNAV